MILAPTTFCQGIIRSLVFLKAVSISAWSGMIGLLREPDYWTPWGISSFIFIHYIGFPPLIARHHLYEHDVGHALVTNPVVRWSSTAEGQEVRYTKIRARQPKRKGKGHRRPLMSGKTGGGVSCAPGAKFPRFPAPF